MTVFVFPDNTVLCNFASVNRIDLLREAVGLRARWTEAVAREALASAHWLPALGPVPEEGWLGDPIAITKPSEIVRVQRIRRAVFGGTAERPLQHPGESETYFVLRYWQIFAKSVWITDDREALLLGRKQQITTLETLDLVRQVVADGAMAARDAFDLMMKMADAGRGLRLPASDLAP
ncbi:MAG TPA: hypothetical protein VIW24_04490 [Aldersonia sp.]